MSLSGILIVSLLGFPTFCLCFTTGHHLNFTERSNVIYGIQDAAVYDMNYVAESVVPEERTSIMKEWASRYPVKQTICG